jgi:ribosomal protein S18 acetylase RimI-like enzyme
MPRNNHQKASITFQLAKPTDANIASRLIFDSFPKMATFNFGLGDAQRAKKTFTALFPYPQHRFSFETSTLILKDERVIGLYIAYPGKEQFVLNWRLGKLLMKQFSLSEKTKLIQRSLPLAFIQEAAKDEFLLSNLAINKSYRGAGFGSQVLAHIEETAIQAGYQKISLLVDIDSKEARRFYENRGFKIKAIHLESNRRVRYLGPGYFRMVKELL